MLIYDIITPDLHEEDKIILVSLVLLWPFMVMSTGGLKKTKICNEEDRRLIEIGSSRPYEVPIGVMIGRVNTSSKILFLIIDHSRYPDSSAETESLIFLTTQQRQQSSWWTSLMSFVYSHHCLPNICCLPNHGSIEARRHSSNIDQREQSSTCLMLKITKIWLGNPQCRLCLNLD